MASSELNFFILRLPVLSQNILKVILHQSSMNYEELQVFITQDILAIFVLKLFAHCLQCSPILWLLNDFIMRTINWTSTSAYEYMYIFLFFSTDSSVGSLMS